MQGFESDCRIRCIEHKIHSNGGKKMKKLGTMVMVSLMFYAMSLTAAAATVQDTQDAAAQTVVCPVHENCPNGADCPYLLCPTGNETCIQNGGCMGNGQCQNAQDCIANGHCINGTSCPGYGHCANGVNSTVDLPFLLHSNVPLFSD